jgi:hypothetical protein
MAMPITVIITGIKKICLFFNFMEYLQNTTNLEIKNPLISLMCALQTFTKTPLGNFS